MDRPISLPDFRALLREKGFRPSRSLGQNFLFDPNMAKSIVQWAGVERQSRVLEIGTGCGYLTAALAEQAAEVLTVEVDSRLAAIARELLANHGNVRFFEGSALEGSKVPAALQESMRTLGRFVVVSNLPYSVSGPLMVELSRFRPPVAKMALMVQKEMAERAAAVPGSADRGVLSLHLQLYYRVGIRRIVPPEVFWPRPKVESALLILDRVREPLDEGLERRWIQLVESAFRARRKQLQKSLRSLWGPSCAARLRAAGIAPENRPERLSAEQFLALASLPEGESSPL